MAERMEKPNAKQAPRSSGANKPAAKATKTAIAGTKPRGTAKPDAKPKPGASAATPVKLLSGGNPQIAKADGDAPVQAYIAAMPGWKRDVGRRLDAIIEQTVPNVRKAVKWNSPFYGIDGQGWFLNFHCFTKYIKVAFFRGSVAASCPSRRVQAEGRALPRHLRRRRARRGADREMGEAGRRVARLGSVADRPDGQGIARPTQFFERILSGVSIAAWPIRPTDEWLGSSEANQVQKDSHLGRSQMKFVCLGFIDETKFAEVNQEDGQKMVEKCFAYDDELRRGGHFVGGEALDSARKAVTLRMNDGEVQVTDGPYAETKEFLGGILLLGSPRHGPCNLADVKASGRENGAI